MLNEWVHACIFAYQNRMSRQDFRTNISMYLLCGLFTKSRVFSEYLVAYFNNWNVPIICIESEYFKEKKERWKERRRDGGEGGDWEGGRERKKSWKEF